MNEVVAPPDAARRSNAGPGTPGAPRTLLHATLPSLRAALQAQALWFAPPPQGEQALHGLPCADRLRWHRHLPGDPHRRLPRRELHNPPDQPGEAACLTVEQLTPADLATLRRVTAQAWLAQPEALLPAFGGQALSQALTHAGFKLFLPPHAGATLPQAHAVCGALEFLLSAPARLAAYPLLGGLASTHHGEPAPAAGRHAPIRALFLLDLVQDFEIIKGQIARAAQPGSPFQACVAVTERFMQSHLWPLVEPFLQVHELPWFRPLGPADAAAALGSGKSLLVTAAETSAPGHAFAHALCRSAPPRTLRVSFQHGHECVGLRHHRSHDLQFPEGVRFASDLVFTWRLPSELPDLHPADQGKCIAVGVTKAIAERAARLLDDEWHQAAADASWPAPSTQGAGGDAAEPPALIIAENLHSVRFASPQRYQRFLDFIAGAHARADWPLLIRSHPGKRTLERRQGGPAYRFLEGQLGASQLQASLGVVSPPSTIVLDAAMCATPVALWSDSPRLGDVEHYRGLPVLTDAADLDPPFFADGAAAGLAAHAWAVDSSAALDGAAMAWQRLCSLVA